MQERKPDKRHLGHKLRIVNNQIGRYFAHCWKSSGMELTRMQCATMHHLKLHGDTEVFQKDLEAEFSISGATASNILKLMEKEDLIIRVPLERDGRLKQIKLTKKGQSMHEMAEKNVDNLEEAMKKGLSQEELAIFSDLLDRVAQNIVDLLEEKIEEN